MDVLDSQTVYQGFGRVDRYRLRHRVHGGGWSQVVDREVLTRGDAAALIPYDPVRDEVVLIEQFRMGPFAAGDHPWLLEVVAGMIEPGESPRDVAARECLEECGASPKAIEAAFSYYPTPAAVREVLHVFCGWVDGAGLPDHLGLQDEGEYIRVLPTPRLTAEQWLAEGKIRNGLTIMAIQWLKLNHQALKEKWAD